MNNEIEKEDVMNDETMMGIIIDMLKVIRAIIIMISLMRLIEGGADILVIMNKNHQKEMLGMIINSPLKEMIFRVWILV